MMQTVKALKWPLLLAAQLYPSLGARLVAVFARERWRYATDWDKTYRDGGWSWLASPEEKPHHYVIASLAAAWGAKTILDVGCGEGHTHAALRGVGYERYLGIDLSPRAIETAAAATDARTRFLTADAEKFETDERFDVVIFNEMIYCFERLIEVLAHYEPMLNEGGFCIISMGLSSFRQALLTERIWRELEQGRDILASHSLFRPNGPLRTIKALRQRGG
jgi:2-polyprenyl-3-methyl-5-hydroxy-6-metoxy-1,4-benzoquinol methylase